MKLKITLGLTSFALSLAIPSSPAAVPAVVEIQKAPAVLGPWQKLPAGSLPVTADGALLDTAPGAVSFYRLKIAPSDPAGGALVLALSDVPSGALALATDLLQTNPVPDWVGASLGPVAYPIYNPAIFAGTNPAYLEFKVVSSPPAGGTNSGFATSPPTTRPPDLGWLIVSLTPEDGPILEFGTDPVSKVEQLRSRAGTAAIRAVRYDANFLAAEDANSNLVASLGTTPIRPPAELLNYLAEDFSAEVSNSVPVGNPSQPPLTSGPYSSYAEFRDDYVSGPVYVVLRNFRASEAQWRWGIRQGIAPTVIPASLKDSTPILSGMSVARVVLDDPSLATITLPAPGTPDTGATVFGNAEGLTLMRVYGTDFSCSNYVLAVSATNSAMSLGIHRNGLSFSWGPWQTVSAGNQGNQKCYDQVYGLAGCCANGYSGCGPTAWAMLYGYWGGLGVPNLIGAGAPPQHNNADVNACIQYEFAHLGTFCAGGGQAATLPLTMWLGFQWAPSRGRGISGVSSWGLPYLSPLARATAIGSIVGLHRPAIVGTGFYSHYPLAWGLATRNYTATLTWWFFGWHTSTWVVTSESDWVTNDGQGNCSPVWYGTADCWYGGAYTCF